VNPNDIFQPRNLTLLGVEVVRTHLVLNGSLVLTAYVSRPEQNSTGRLARNAYMGAPRKGGLNVRF